MFTQMALHTCVFVLNDFFVKCSALIGFHFWGALRDDTKNDFEGG